MLKAMFSDLQRQVRRRMRGLGEKAQSMGMSDRIVSVLMGPEPEREANQPPRWGSLAPDVMPAPEREVSLPERDAPAKSGASAARSPPPSGFASCRKSAVERPSRRTETRFLSGGAQDRSLAAQATSLARRALAEPASR